MLPRTPAIAAVAALLVAGSVAGFLVAGGSVDDGLTLSSNAQDGSDSNACSSVPSFSFPSDASVQEWTGDVPSDADGGTLTLQAHHGGVDVATWDQAGYKVEIAETDDEALEPTVEAGVTDGSFDLTVSVRDTSERQVGPATVSAGVGDAPQAHVKVRVPSLAYESVEADSRPDRNDSFRVDLRLGVPDDPTLNETDDDEVPIVASGLQAGSLAADAHDRSVLGQDLEADQATLESHDGDVCVQGTQAGELAVDSHDGAVGLADVEADQAELDSHDGDLDAEALRTADLQAETHDGDVTVDMVPTASGEATLDSHDGAVTLSVATGGDYAYDAVADSHDGDVTVQLPGADVQTDDRDDAVHARTQGYEDREVRTDLTATSHDGDVTIVGR